MQEKYRLLAEKAQAWVEAHKAEFVSEIQGMARIPSVSREDLAQPGAPFGPECRKMLDYALERGRCYGFDVQDYDGYAGAISMGNPENALGVVAHLDVVPVGEGWIYPPFGATYLPDQDALVGRGVDDNKGPAVAALFAMRILRELNWPLKHGVVLLCGLSEEAGMADMKALVERGISFPKTSLVPDGGYPVNYGQKGSLGAEISAECAGNLIQLDAGTARNVIPDRAEAVLAVEEAEVKAALQRLPGEMVQDLEVCPCPEGTRLVAKGRAGHAAFPDGSVNAIQRLARVLPESGLLKGSCAQALRNLAELSADAHGISVGAEYSDQESGALTLVYSVVHLQSGRIKVQVDCRYPITCDGEALKARVRAAWADRGFEAERLSLSKPFYIPKEDPRVRALQGVYRALTGRDDPPYTMGGGTYSRVVPNAITFGAGIPESGRVRDFLPEGHGGAHAKDEALVMEKAYRCAQIYAVALAVLDEVLAE